MLLLALLKPSKKEEIPHMLKYDVVLLDMDGTTADTDEVILRTMYALYDLYRDGKRTPDEEIYYFSGPHISLTMEQEFPEQDTQFMCDEFCRISHDLYPKYMKEYPHCHDVLLELKKKGVKIGIVTNKSTEYAKYCLTLLRLEDIVDYLVGFDDVKEGKPNPEGINKCIDYFNAKDLKKVIYIGDNKIDLESADNAHIDCCLVNWGPRVLPKDIHPAYTINNFLELRRIILDE